MAPARLKLTITVMSIGLALDSGGGLKQLCSLTKMSLRVSSFSGSACTGAATTSERSGAANQ